MMTLDEMKLAVCEKLPGLVDILPESSPDDWGAIVHYPAGIYWKTGQLINWPTEGLQVCHEAEKLLTEKESVWYLQRLAQVRLRQGEGGMIAVMIDKLAYAPYEQRLEALCRVWFPERFLSKEDINSGNAMDM